MALLSCQMLLCCSAAALWVGLMKARTSPACSSRFKVPGRSRKDTSTMLRLFTLVMMQALREAHSWATWCAWVPVPLQKSVDGCTDYLGDPNVEVAGKDGCAAWCRWVPVLAWHYPEGCSGCGRAVAGMSIDEAAEALSASKDLNSLPEWCLWVPSAALKHVSSCNGYKSETPLFSASCEFYCEWVPKPAWQFPSGCQNCSTKVETNAKAAGSKALSELIP